MGSSGVLGLPRPLVESEMTVSYTFWSGENSTSKSRRQFRSARENLLNTEEKELKRRLQSRSTILMDSVEIKEGDRGSMILLCHLDEDSIRQEDLNALNKSVEGIIGNFISSNIST